MLSRLLNRLNYRLERLFVRGARYQLLLIAALIGLISVTGGALVLWAGSGFEDLGAAAWWAFLRLSDPGYLGDDVGPVNRTISTILTVLGYVVFLGALVAVMTRWLTSRMERLESGLTPVARDDHVLVLGWTNRTETIVEQLLRSTNRVRRFLRRHGARDLHVVVMAREVTAALVQDLRDALGDAWDEQTVTLRSGTRLRPEHLERVDYRNAAAIIVPGYEFGPSGTGAADTHTVKTLLSLGSWEDEGGGEEGDERLLPYTVAEVFDARKVAVARKAYPGELEVVASDAVVSRLLAQNVRHPGLSRVYNEVLSLGAGHELYVRPAPAAGGQSFEELAATFGSSLLLGVVRRGASGFEPRLNPPPDFRILEDDRLVLLARSWADTEASQRASRPRYERGRPGFRDEASTRNRVLVLGWNHKVPALIREFGTYEKEEYEIQILASVPAERRAETLDRYALRPGRVSVENVVGDYTEEAELAAMDPASYDTVVMVGSDRQRTEEESDARTIVGSLLLQELLADRGAPGLILELLDPENVPLVDRSRGEVIISPLILSYMLAQVALRRELRAVFDELFTAGGAELSFRALEEYVEPDLTSVTFGDVQASAQRMGEIALGVQADVARPVRLVPQDDEELTVRPGAQVVTLLTIPPSHGSPGE